MSSLDESAALGSPMERRHSPVYPASADTQIPSPPISTLPPPSSLRSSPPPTSPASFASSTSPLSDTIGSFFCSSEASVGPLASSSRINSSSSSDRVPTVGVPVAGSAAGAAVDTTAVQHKSVLNTTHCGATTQAVGSPADDNRKKDDANASTVVVDNDSTNKNLAPSSVLPRESCSSAAVPHCGPVSTLDSPAPRDSSSCTLSLVPHSSSISSASLPFSTPTPVPVPCSSASCAPPSFSETHGPKPVCGPDEGSSRDSLAPKESSSLTTLYPPHATRPLNPGSTTASSPPQSVSASTGEFSRSNLSSSPSSSSLSSSSSRASIPPSRATSLPPSSNTVASSSSGEGVASSRSTSAGSSAASSVSSALGVVTAETSRQGIEPAEKKFTSIVGAMPHPSRVTALRTAALRQHILQRRRQQARDGKAAQKITQQPQPTDLNLFWKEIVVDLDDDGTRCDICGNYDATPNDQILLCDGCDVAAHQTCYGVPTVPEGEWFCQYCAMQRQVQSNFNHLQQVAARAAKALPRDRSHVKGMPFSFKEAQNGNSDHDDDDATAAAAALKGEVERMEKEGRPLCLLPKTCPLCPRHFGAHMRCSEGGYLWVHVNCIVWLPEGWIANVEDCGGMMETAGWRLEETCSICGIDEGALVKCAASACNAVFHPICCLMAGGGMNLTGQIPLRRKNDVSFHAFCVRHRGKAFEESVDAEEPLEFNVRHPDAHHPFIRAAHLARRNRDILFYTAQCHKEKSTWGLRMGAYLVRELNENLVAFRMLWQRLVEACNPKVPPALPSSSSHVEEKPISKVGAEPSV